MSTIASALSRYLDRRPLLVAFLAVGAADTARALAVGSLASGAAMSQRKIILVGNLGRAEIYTTDQPTVAVGEASVQVIEYLGMRVVTLAQVDAVHQRPKGTARRTLSANRSRLIAGEDFIEITADEIRAHSLRAFFPPRTAKGVLLTESGYLMLAKSFTDDLAWKVQRALVASYFRKPAPARRVKVPYAVGRHDTIGREQADMLRDTLDAGAKALPLEDRGAFLREGWSRLKSHFKCSYRDIPAAEFDEALSLLTRHVLRHEPAQDQPAIGYARPDARAALLDATNALARALPVLAELVNRGDATNDAREGSLRA